MADRQRVATMKAKFPDHVVLIDRLASFGSTRVETV
jgi:hypothetical protein